MPFKRLDGSILERQLRVAEKKINKAKKTEGVNLEWCKQGTNRFNIVNEESLKKNEHHLIWCGILHVC